MSCENCDDQMGYPLIGGRWVGLVYEVHFGVCADCNDDALRHKPIVKITLEKSEDCS